MKEQILEAQASLLNESKKQIQREFIEGNTLLKETEKNVATSLANGSRFVVSGGVMNRYHTKLQLIRTLKENLVDLAELYQMAFGESIEEACDPKPALTLEDLYTLKPGATLEQLRPFAKKIEEVEGGTVLSITDIKDRFWEPLECKSGQELHYTWTMGS